MRQPHASPDAPFQILVVGDFSGLNQGGMRHEDRVRRQGPLRLETVDDLLDRLQPTVRVTLRDGEPVELDFREIEDFHPDRLIRRIPELGRRLRSIDRVVEGAVLEGAKDGGDAQSRPGGGGAGDRESGGGTAGDAAAGPPGALLDDIVAEATGEPATARARESAPVRELRSWIGEVVAPHLEEARDPDREALRARLRADVAERLLEVLHAPPVRHLESLWRALLFLAATGGSSPDVRVFVLDTSDTELDAMLRSEEPRSSRLYRALAEAPPGSGRDTPFAAAVLTRTFGPEPEDVFLLNRLAMLAQEAGVPLLSGARPEVMGMRSFSAEETPVPGQDAPELWQELRATPGVRSVALLAPAFLLRLPYGEETDPCETVPVEEVWTGRSEDQRDRPDASVPAERYLWGHPAFLGAAGLALAFARDGWTLDASPTREFTSRPIHVDPDGRVLAHPVERVWRVDEGERVVGTGVTPLVAYRESATLRLPGLGSLSSAGGPLSGWWISGG